MTLTRRQFLRSTAAALPLLPLAVASGDEGVRRELEDLDGGSLVEWFLNHNELGRWQSSSAAVTILQELGAGSRFKNYSGYEIMPVRDNGWSFS